MPQFVKIGNLYVSVNELRAVQCDGPGSQVIVHYGARVDPLSTIDGRALMDYVQKNLAFTVPEVEAATEAASDEAPKAKAKK